MIAEHLSAIVWPLPKGVKFPHEQAVKCAHCGRQSTRIINSRSQAKGLWFCSREHKLIRRRAVLAGELKPVSKLPKVSLEDRFDSDWGELGLNPRRSIKSIRSPTPFDNIYGVMPTSGDLKE